MTRFFQWAWDRHRDRYSLVNYLLGIVVSLPIYLCLSFGIVRFENSNRYWEAAAASVVAVMVIGLVITRPGARIWRDLRRWVPGGAIDSADILVRTYTWARGVVTQWPVHVGLCAGLLAVAVGAIVGAPGSRLVQYAVVGFVWGAGSLLIGVHTLAEASLRPVRIALAGGTDIGDSLPRSRPTYASWANIALISSTLSFGLFGAMLSAVLPAASQHPIVWVLIGCVLMVGFGVPITTTVVFSPSMQPIRDLAQGTERVAAGDYTQRLPVVQDDDLGALAASFNRMQAGLAERQRLQAAFGTYVDPALAQRLLEQGDDVFSGERREVTVMFVDIRDFTPFAEANTAEDTVARLNALFEIVVPAVVDAGGHVNKFLGDGALAVFGAPNDLEHHADAAVSAAVLIARRVAERFGAALRIGIGINTGKVIAGTIGAAGKLEFTLIGDTVNVAARVEQLTKTTGDVILLTDACVDDLATRPPGLIDRGSHVLKGKSAILQVYGLAL